MLYFLMKLLENFKLHTWSILLFYFILCVCVLKNKIALLLTGVASLGRWVCRAQGMWGLWRADDWEAGKKGSGLEARPTGSPTHFWQEADLTKYSWQVIARPSIRLRNSWKSSCPSELRSNFFIMRPRTPGSFWFFVKAPSSVFMKIRNSALESLLLLPSLPACLWKTAIRDSMHCSVSVGLDTVAMSEKSEARRCEPILHF